MTGLYGVVAVQRLLNRIRYRIDNSRYTMLYLYRSCGAVRTRLHSFTPPSSNTALRAVSSTLSPGPSRHPALSHRPSSLHPMFALLRSSGQVLKQAADETYQVR